jgi:MSHA biogenesis protein MshO
MWKTRSLTNRPPEGFSLPELVMVILITSILAAVVGSFVSQPMEAYRDQTRRATLVDVAESALGRMGRDIRRALPNTVRVSPDNRSIEFLHTMDGGRYRGDPGTNPGPTAHTTASDVLDFSGDTQFNSLGRLDSSNFTYGVPLAAATRLAVYPVSLAIYAQAAADSSPALITPSTSTITITDDTDEDQLALSVSHRFTLQSPRRRFYVVDTPTSYLCNLTSNTITRYWGYTIAAAQPTDPAVAPLNAGQSALATNRVTACSFTYQGGTSQRAGLVTISLTLSEAGEQVRLLEQLHVENVP